MLRPWLNALISNWPSLCRVCHAWPAQPVCPSCIKQFAQPRLRCISCATPIPAGVSQCGTCILHPPPLDACWCAVPYAYPWAGLIVDYKFRHQAGLARTFVPLLRKLPQVQTALDTAHRLLPMPLSNQRLQERGFNQALLIAQQLNRHKTCTRTLLRIQDTAPQSRLTKDQRMRNVQHAFAIEPAQTAALQGQHIVLVDDVMTSGASLFAAAKTLRTAGVAHITALVFARTDMD